MVFDTWSLNCDRHQPRENKNRVRWENVFLSLEGTSPGKVRLKAIDQGHCFTCGRELTKRLSRLDQVRDATIYGLFPEFQEFVTIERTYEIIEEVQGIPRSALEEIIKTVPAEWQVSDPVKDAWCDLLGQRAGYLTTSSSSFRQTTCSINDQNRMGRPNHRCGVI